MNRGTQKGCEMKGGSHVKKESTKEVWFNKETTTSLLLLWELNDLNRLGHDSCPHHFGLWILS